MTEGAPGQAQAYSASNRTSTATPGTPAPGSRANDVCSACTDDRWPPLTVRGRAHTFFDVHVEKNFRTNGCVDASISGFRPAATIAPS